MVTDILSSVNRLSFYWQSGNLMTSKDNTWCFMNKVFFSSLTFSHCWVVITTPYYQWYSWRLIIYCFSPTYPFLWYAVSMCLWVLRSKAGRKWEWGEGARGRGKGAGIPSWNWKNVSSMDSLLLALRKPAWGHRIIKYPELKDTHKDRRVQLPTLSFLYAH